MHTCRSYYANSGTIFFSCWNTTLEVQHLFKEILDFHIIVNIYGLCAVKQLSQEILMRGWGPIFHGSLYLDQSYRKLYTMHNFGPDPLKSSGVNKKKTLLQSDIIHILYVCILGVLSHKVNLWKICLTLWLHKLLLF